jgi:hypothetical protein
LEQDTLNSPEIQQTEKRLCRSFCFDGYLGIPAAFSCFSKRMVKHFWKGGSPEKINVLFYAAPVEQKQLPT